MRYFIEHQGAHIGPYDLLGIVRKIRNGSLGKQDAVLSDNTQQPKPAYQHDELYDVFVEQDQHEQEFTDIAESRPGMTTLFTRAWMFIKDDQSVVVVSGLAILTIAIITGLLAAKAPPLAAAIVAPLLSSACFTIFFISVLRLSRVQLLSPRYLGTVLRKHGISLAGAAALVAVAFMVPWLASIVLGPVGWGLALLFSLPAVAYLVFVPLIIADRELPLLSALSCNHAMMRALELNGFIQIMLLLLIAIISLIPIITALIIVPLVMLALCELYESASHAM